MADLNKIEQYNKWTIVPDDFSSTYLATKYVQEPKIVVPENVLDVFKEKLNDNHIYLGTDEILKEIIAAVVKGNIILQGPPGTGKTALAKILCEIFNTNSIECTAVSDWTTYDTIGGLQPAVNEENHEIVVGKNGRIVESILACCNTVLDEQEYGGTKQASWLIIDELNRCEIDKVFGDLFTIFGNDGVGEEKAISLWFENNINKKKIYIPNRYRIIGAMNNIDKNFVFDISQGLSRRFTFITILPPIEDAFEDELKNVKVKAINRVVNKLGETAIDKNSLEQLLEDSIFKSAEVAMCDLIKHMRYEKEGNENYLGLQLGTAQIIDVYENILLNMVLFGYSDAVDKRQEIHMVIDSAICNRVIPQMDGYDFEKVNSFYEYISNDGEYEWFKKTKESVKQKL